MSYDAAPRASTSSSSTSTCSSASSHGRRSPVWGRPTSVALEDKPASRQRMPRTAASTSSPLHFLYPAFVSNNNTPSSSFASKTQTTPRRTSRGEAKAAAAAARRSSDLARLLDPAYMPAAARRQLEAQQYAGQREMYVDDDGEMHDPDFKHFPVLPPGMGVNSSNNNNSSNSSSSRARDQYHHDGGSSGLRRGSTGSYASSSAGGAGGYVTRSGAYGSSLAAARRGTSPRRPARPPFDWELAVDEAALADEYPEEAVRADELSTRLREEQRAKERRAKEDKDREERRRKSIGDAPVMGRLEGQDRDRGYGGTGRRSWEDPGPMRVPSPMNDVLLLKPAQPRRGGATAPTTTTVTVPKLNVPATIAYQQPGLGRHPVSKVTSSRGVPRRTRDSSFSTFATATTTTQGTGSTTATSWESTGAPVREADAPVGGVYVLGASQDAEKEAERQRQADLEKKEKEAEKAKGMTARIAKKARRFSWGSSKKPAPVLDEKTSTNNWSPQTPSTPLSPTSAFSHSSTYSHSPSPYIDEEDEDQGAEEDEHPTSATPIAYAPTCGQSLRRQWHALALSFRFGVFRAQRRVTRRVRSVL